MRSIRWIMVVCREMFRWFDTTILHRLLPDSATFSRSTRVSAEIKGVLAGSGDVLERDTVLANMLDKVAIDDTSFDLYLTLGAAFRRNGEYSRAVAVHEQLVSAQQLSAAQQHQSTLELASDYAVAGMLDRAETLLLSLVQKNPAHAENRTQLLRIFEKQQDWQQAIEHARSGPVKSPLPAVELIAQYQCELAEDAFEAGHTDSARERLADAFKMEPQCGRALLMVCQHAIDSGDSAGALAAFDRIEKHHPELAPEKAAAIFYLLRESGDQALLSAHLAYIRQRQNSYTVIKLARQAIAELEGEKAAAHFFLEQVSRRPSLQALYDWAERELEVTKSREKDKMVSIVQMLRGVVDEKPVYRCNQCGYRCNELQWRCPGCESWKSVQVIIGVEGE